MKGNIQHSMLAYPIFHASCLNNLPGILLKIMLAPWLFLKSYGLWCTNGRYSRNYMSALSLFYSTISWWKMPVLQNNIHWWRIPFSLLWNFQFWNYYVPLRAYLREPPFSHLLRLDFFGLTFPCIFVHNGDLFIFQQNKGKGGQIPWTHSTPQHDNLISHSFTSKVSFQLLGAVSRFCARLEDFIPCVFWNIFSVHSPYYSLIIYEMGLGRLTPLKRWLWNGRFGASLYLEGGRGTRLDDKVGVRGNGGGRGGDVNTTAEEYRPVWYTVSRAAPLLFPRSSGWKIPMSGGMRIKLFIKIDASFSTTASDPFWQSLLTTLPIPPSSQNTWRDRPKIWKIERPPVVILFVIILLLYPAPDQCFALDSGFDRSISSNAVVFVEIPRKIRPKIMRTSRPLGNSLGQLNQYPPSNYLPITRIYNRALPGMIEAPGGKTMPSSKPRRGECCGKSDLWWRLRPGTGTVTGTESRSEEKMAVCWEKRRIYLRTR